MISNMISKKIISPSTLAKKKLHQKNVLVFTNGCFDLLHAGHVTYLEKAKHLGSILIVALNTDASVKKLKGKNRPINTLKDRLKVIAALESVDYVTWFSEETPLRLIQLLKPHYLVKGGDYQAKGVVGFQELKQWGGQVKIIPFVKGKSTTKTIEAVKSK